MDTQEALKTQVDGDGMDVGQKVMIGIVAVVIVAGGYFIFRPSLPEPEAVTPLAPALLVPVTDGDKTYTLEKLAWVFEDQNPDESGAPITRVRLKLEGFKRNEVPIDVGLYRLGTYRGSCTSSVDMPAGYVVSDTGAAAFARCWFAGGGRELAVFQEGNYIVAKVRTVGEEDAQPAPFVPILTVDITKIVQTI